MLSLHSCFKKRPVILFLRTILSSAFSLTLVFSSLFGLIVYASVATDETPNPIGLRAFESTLYPNLRQKCSQCHGDGGQAIGHSVSDVRAAYQAARLFVDFSNLETSEFMDRVRSRHWKEHDTNAQGMPESEMRSHLQAWWSQGESETVPRFELTSQPIPLPTTLPTMASGRFTEMKWTPFNPPFSQCEGSVEIQSVTNAESTLIAYRVRNPKFGCKDVSVRVMGVFFSVSNELAPYENIYKSVDKTISPAEHASGTTLSKDLMILEPRKANTPTGDSLRLMIQTVSPL